MAGEHFDEARSLSICISGDKSNNAARDRKSAAREFTSMSEDMEFGVIVKIARANKLEEPKGVH